VNAYLTGMPECAQQQAILVAILSSTKCTCSLTNCNCSLTKWQEKILEHALQVYSQLGNDTPDVDVSSLKAMYNTTQSLIADDKISAGHDISDGGIAVTLLEAAFAGNCGIQVPADI